MTVVRVLAYLRQVSGIGHYFIIIFCSVLVFTIHPIKPLYQTRGTEKVSLPHTTLAKLLDETHSYLESTPTRDVALETLYRTTNEEYERVVKFVEKAHRPR